MNYWEDFFSLDKIIYPALGSFLMGIFYFIFSYTLKLQFDEILFYMFTVTGFIMGNLLKIKKINQIREQEQKKQRKKKKKII